MITFAPPFQGLPVWMQVFFYCAFVVVLVMLAWTIALFVSARRARRGAPAPANPDGFLWVYLVPALNEEVTIADSVERLLGVECAHRLVLVVDDGSTDRTPEILRGIDAPELVVLRRNLPDARRGKAAALNDGWRYLREVLASERLSGWTRDRVIVVVVDADGRLDPHAPGYLAGQLADPRVGGIQLLVRIYNRSRVLTWFQDVEFGIYGYLYQLGRTSGGTAGMGGNGQCNRLTTLDELADDEGPWRHTLTEDQELGLRLILAGWKGVHEVRATVSQQGLSSMRPLLRQRTRWAQGNLQALTHAGPVARLHRSLLTRVDLVGSLLLPFIQFVVLIDVAATVVFLILDVGGLRSGARLVDLIPLYLLAVGAVMVGTIAWGAGRHGLVGGLWGALVANVYLFYTYLIWPVLVRAAARQLSHRRDWAKTAREPIPGATENTT